MTIINEDLARRNKENYSHFGYVPGSATAEYNAVIKDATEKIEKAKAKVSEEGKIRLDRLLESFKVRYANWINKSNSNGAGHVSVMIAGPSNYDVRKHQKFIDRERKIMAEYDDIKNIDDKIWSILNGDKIIKSDDSDAIDKLKDKLAKAEEEHQGYKDFNVKARREGTEQLAAYILTNSNGRIKGIKDRIAKLERLAKIAEDTPQVEILNKIEIKIIDNIEVQRLQIIFNDKPGIEIRNVLKKNGFRWSQTNGAWQRYRSAEAIRIAKDIVDKIS